MKDFVKTYLAGMGYYVNGMAQGIIRECEDWYSNRAIENFHIRANLNGSELELTRLNFAKRCCADDANLCEIISVAPKEESASLEFIEKFLEKNRFDVRYREQLEKTSADGTVGAYIYLKGADYYEHNGIVTAKNGQIKINYVEADIVLNALVGFIGLAPSLETIKNNIDLALANKESLVVGGELIKKALRHSKSNIYPVDSEHSAIYKCFKACKRSDVKEILITASGGAFRNLKRSELKNVTARQALKHPTWKMGKRVTIDSATMLNKGFEIIEAYYLFDYALNKIKVLMHDESYVHSILKLKDGSYLGEVSKPSMVNPISYSLKDKKDAINVKHVKSLDKFGNFHFHEFNKNRYPMVTYALCAIKEKGIMPCVLNASDEVAVSLFLKGKISFLDIEKIVGKSLKTYKNQSPVTYDLLARVDQKVRNNIMEEYQ